MFRSMETLLNVQRKYKKTEASSFHSAPFFRYLCEKVVPGNRVTVLGVYAIKKMAKPSNVSRTSINRSVTRFPSAQEGKFNKHSDLFKKVSPNEIYGAIRRF